MTLFTVGPVEMDPEILEAGSLALPYFRTAEFSDLMFRLQDDYLSLLAAGEGSQAMFLTASGSGGMEAAVSSVFKPERDKLLIINGGSFGQRFVDLAAFYGISHEVLKLAFNDDLSEDMLEKYRNQGFTGLLINHHETSIGKIYDLEMLGRFCRDEGLYLIVDAVSSFLSEEIKMAEWGVDLVMTASQKSLALAPGLALVACSERLMSERIMPSEGLSYYLSLRSAASNQLRGQTPFTPALAVIYQLEKRFEGIMKHGVTSEYRKKAELAEHFRNRVSELGMKIPSYRKSNALTPLLSDPWDAYDLFLKLKDEHGLVITPSGGEFQHKLTRVGHMGHLTTPDLDRLIETMLILEKS